MTEEKTISLEYIPFPNPDVILQEEEGGKAVLVNFDTGNAISLNTVSRFIWETADGSISVEGIIKKIKQNFSSAPDDISKDVIETVKTLKSNGFFGSEVWRG